MSAAGVSVDIVRELRAICGDDFVSEALAAPATQFQWKEGSPSAFVQPGSADEVAAVLQMANVHGLSVYPVGGNTNQTVGGEPAADIVLSTSRLTEVEHYDHADLTVGVGAGTPISRLNAMVGADRLMFACDPAFPERATAGGVLAAASQGPLRQGYGGMRDFCIGIRFVTGDGRKAKGGGRVVKNVAGYDLMKLLIGSFGTLAVITSASFKLFPAPRQTRSFLAEFATAAEALKFRDLVLRSPLAPMCLELVSPGARRLLRPVATSDTWVICLRAAGSDAVLARYRKELGSAVTRELEGDKEAEMWRAIENFPESPAPPDGAPTRARAIVSVPISQVGAAIEALQPLGVADLLGLSLVGRPGAGSLVPSFATGGEAMTVLEKSLDALRNRLSGDCSVIANAPGKLWRLMPSHLESMRAVKQALDPRNVLRGRELS